MEPTPLQPPGAISPRERKERFMMVLITGATGTNGLEVVRQTLGRGGRVRAFVRDSASARAVSRRVPSTADRPLLQSTALFVSRSPVKAFSCDGVPRLSSDPAVNQA